MASAFPFVERLKACVPLGARVLGVTAVYYVGAKISIFSMPPGLPVTTIWISAGIALFCLLAIDFKVWPGIAIGSFLSNIAVVPPPEALLVVLGNTLAPVCAYLALRRVGFRKDLDRARDALTLVLLAAFGATLLSAAVGPLALVIAGVWPASESLRVWVVWWSSDVLGVLVVTPFLLSLRSVRQILPRFTWRRWLEFIGLLAATFVVTLVSTRSLAGLFLAFPLIVLAAWRFQLIGVAPCALIVSAVSVYTASRNYGVLETQSVLENALLLQAFNGTFVLTGLLLSAVITQWRRARAEVEEAYATLADTIDHLQESMLPGDRQLAGLRDLSFTKEVGVEKSGKE